MIQALDFDLFYSALASLGIVQGDDTAQRTGLNFLMNRLQTDPRIISNPRSVELTSYILASIGHECCEPRKQNGETRYVRTFQPIQEFGSPSYFEKNYGSRKDLGNVFPGDGMKYHGRGYVQNTGRLNALKTGQRLSGMTIDLQDAVMSPVTIEAFERESRKTGKGVIVDEQLFVREPDLLLIPRISYEDMMSGLFEGRYTGKKITDYITESAADYLNARRTINGDVVKNGGKIANLALSIESAIRKAIAVAPTNTLPVENQTVAAKSGRVQIGADPAKLGEDKTDVIVAEPASTTADQIVEVAHQLKALRPGWISAIGAAAFAFFQNNPYFFWGAVTIVVVLIAVGAYIYVQRMKLAADPTQHTPK